MRLRPTNRPILGARGWAWGFTLAEVLAALVFMAIVIPVAVEGLRVASLAGQVGDRKASAARIAERVMNELIAGGQTQLTGQRGSIQEGTQEYEWRYQLEPWSEGAMQLMIVEVAFYVQGREYDVQLCTLLDRTTVL